MSKRIQYTVEGEVQGVNYRAWAVSKAKDFDITGYAKNASNGTVVGEAQGSSDSVKQFVDSLYKAPSPAKVSKVESSDMQIKEGDSGFQRGARPNRSDAILLHGLISICSQHASTPKTRRQQFRTSKHALIKEYFPAPDAPNIKTTEAAWAHPVYTFSQMEQVKIQHRDAKDWSDWVALTFMRVLRWGLDTVSGYKHDPDQHPVRNGAATPAGSGEHSIDKADRLRVRPFTHMTERKWLMRFIFLESVAGVPGMVAGMLRHLHSMRRMKRDNGWIETLLEESYNERMHLLTFLKMAEPGWFMRMMVLGAQGVFFNSMFVSYLVSPRTCHRFVGYLKEEAVITYTRAIGDIEAGKLPMFEKMSAPDIAVQYWDMPEGRRTMKDLLLYIRADESKHREVNHTLGNLDQKNDPNPYNSKYKDEAAPHPVKDIKFQRPTGWEREEVIGEDKAH
ncbi:Alternative oxidase [Hortaea werneckii]|nr:Alternative oxidase [Hortaea werneckii]